VTLIPTDGATIAFDRAGTGPPVLLIQGVGVIGGGWRPQIDGLASQYSLYTFDNRGIGQSTLNGSGLSIEAMAADALAVMDAAGAARFQVVGHSMGGVRGRDISSTPTPATACRSSTPSA
jgi:3-oxoadipate enol-lactonase